MVCERSSLLSIRQMIFFLGMVMGCLCTGQLSDKYGRKKTMLVSLIFLVSTVCAIISDTSF